MATRTRIVQARRRRYWVSTDSILTSTGASTAFIDLFAAWRTTQGVTGNPIGTVAGVRLSFAHRLDAPATISGVHIGLIVSESIGGTPDPFSNPNSDWMMNTHYFKAFDVQAGSTGIVSRDVVIKAQRKLTDSQKTLFLVLGSDTSAGTLNFHSRALFLMG